MRKGLLWCSSLYSVPMNLFYIEEAVQVSLSNGGRDTISAAMVHHQLASSPGPIFIIKLAGTKNIFFVPANFNIK